ncbi:MAG TPA: serine/threonine-protein kinase, partial [Kofleriaceae bacterium]|nr:serine/threonine-protein kinase [Kofleriaceae bacterium]
MRGVAGDDATRTADRTVAPPPRRSESDPSGPFPPRSRARYEILGEHGRGGLGRVSRARDRELGRDVAIKELIQRGDVREVRFLREALITARLEHPGIVPIHEAGRWDDGTPFYAMKLVSGRPLKSLLAARDTLDQRLGLLHHVIAVADAIAYAHGQRIIHRDLKPANVIVGDFGETVVIDWGLAKDLSAADDTAEHDGPYRSLASSDLTGAGGVIGTPAYMAPEQARGEPADERVDVFAIGAMLWELCTQTRVPPDDARPRDRALRHAGIDRDLGAIIIKALASDPADRYHNAAALAADLKAFQSGARIAARRYSLLAALAHWTRRRRRLAISVAAAAVIAVTGAAVFVHDIARERDRADAAAIDARAQQRSAEQARDELVLQHAELQLRGDPTAAMAVLETYRGGDAARLRRLRAEALGRGVATGVLRPHAEPVRFVAADPTGAIVSIGQDRTLRITHGGRSTTLASNVLVPTKIRYMPGARAVAYATAPTGIAVLSLVSHAITSVATGNLRAMDLLRDGTRLAALTRDGTITVWSIASAIRSSWIADAIDLEFATAGRLVIQQRGGLRTLWLEPGRRGEAIAIASRDFEVDAERAVISDDQGHIALLSSQLALLSRISVCHRSVTNVDLIPHSDLVAFVCEEAIAGVARYDAAAGGLSVVDTFPTVERPYRIWRDEPGTRIAVADDSNLVYLYDIATRMVTRYDAATQVSGIQLPTRDFDRLLVGDMHGNVRIWDPPRREARKLLQAPSAVSGVVFDAGGSALIASGSDGIARR